MSAARVMIVDDDPGVLRTLQLCVQKKGYECRAVDHAAEAIKLIKEFKPEVLLTDVNMPGMTGLELVRAVRTLSPFTVSIVMTGYATQEMTIQSIKEGVFDFIHKPVLDQSSLDLPLEHAVGHSRMLSERQQFVEKLALQNEQLETQLAHIRIAYDELENDLMRAQRIQRNLLPERLYPVGNFQFFGYYCPCEMLGGDFFDRFRIDNHTIALYIADVSGHGVAASLVTVIVRQLLRNQLRSRDTIAVLDQPDKTLEMLNLGLCNQKFDNPMHVTMSYLVLDSYTGKIRWSSAGHPPPLLAGQPGIETIAQEPAPALGLFENSVYQNLELSLEPDTSLLIYTDGLTEACDVASQKLSPEHLLKHLEGDTAGSACQLGERVEAALFEHIESEMLEDDLSFLIIHHAARPINPDDPSVKVVDPEKSGHKVSEKSEAKIAVGSTDTETVVQIIGAATWKLAKAVSEVMGDVNSEHSLHIDLSQCESFDSTMLGLICRESSRVDLYKPSERISTQMKEVGIFDRMNKRQDVLPLVDLEIYTPSMMADRKAAKAIILHAHEELMSINQENLKHFKGVVDSLKS